MPQHDKEHVDNKQSPLYLIGKILYEDLFLLYLFELI
jgi:hypothetical protein